jgi:hypothetical protein
MASLKNTSPHDNAKNETALTFCHGVLNGDSFEIPPKINVVTIMKLGDNCPLNKGFDKEFQEFLQGGSKFFEYNSIRRTPECEALQNSLNGQVNETNTFLAAEAREEGRMSSERPLFSIRNHVEESEMNNAELTFSDDTNALMSTMIYDERGVLIKTVPIKYLDPDNGAEVKKIDITRLIIYLCGLGDFDAVTKMKGRLTIVLVICRGVDPRLGKPTLAIMRQRSDTSDFLPKFSFVYIHGMDGKDGLVGQIIDIKDGSYIIGSPDGTHTIASKESVDLVNRVQLKGLKMETLNGSKGTFVKFSTETNRFQIKMDDGKFILVSPVNLLGLHEPTGGRKTRRQKRKKVRRTHNVRPRNKVSRKKYK